MGKDRDRIERRRIDILTGAHCTGPGNHGRCRSPEYDGRRQQPLHRTRSPHEHGRPRQNPGGGAPNGPTARTTGRWPSTRATGAARRADCQTLYNRWLRTCGMLLTQGTSTGPSGHDTALEILTHPRKWTLGVLPFPMWRGPRRGPRSLLPFWDGHLGSIDLPEPILAVHLHNMLVKKGLYPTTSQHLCDTRRPLLGMFLRRRPSTQF